MGKSFKILLLALFCITNLQAQSDLLFYMGKKFPWQGNNELLQNYIKRFDLQDSVYYRIPVTFWIYNTNRGEKGATPAEVKLHLQLLNKYFNQINKTGITFYLAQIHYINRTRHMKVGYTIEASWITALHHQNGTMNVHLIKELSLKTIATAHNFGGTYNALTNSIILSRSNLVSGLAHETGHFLCLEHPHKNWNKGPKKAESVSRTMLINTKDSIRNCEARGDCLCDTPAEPDLYSFLDDSCHYIGHVTDPWGEPYKPKTDNIMSYQKNKRCRKHFTRMQIAAMLYCLDHSKYAKAWRVSRPNISYTFDLYEPDNTWSTSTWLKPFSVQQHTFHTIYTKKRPLLPDSVDMVKIAPNYKKNYIIFDKSNYFFPQMTMEVYDQYHKKIYEKNIHSPATIGLPVVDSPVLYIKLTLKSEYLPATLFDYKIKLEQY